MSDEPTVEQLKETISLLTKDVSYQEIDDAVKVIDPEGFPSHEILKSQLHVAQAVKLILQRRLQK